MLSHGNLRGNQWVFIVPDHKAGYSLGEVALGGAPLDPHDVCKCSWQKKYLTKFHNRCHPSENKIFSPLNEGFCTKKRKIPKLNSCSPLI